MIVDTAGIPDDMCKYVTVSFTLLNIMFVVVVVVVVGGGGVGVGFVAWVVMD
jgi:hypothetical protein